MEHAVHLRPDVERLAEAIARARDRDDPGALGALGQLSDVLGDALALGLEQLARQHALLGAEERVADADAHDPREARATDDDADDGDFEAPALALTAADEVRAQRVALRRAKTTPHPWGPMGHLPGVLRDAVALGLEQLDTLHIAGTERWARFGAPLHQREAGGRLRVELHDLRVSPGDELELQLATGQWVRVFFRSCVRGGPPLFYLPLDVDVAAPIAVPRGALFRWPFNGPDGAP